MSSDTDNSNWAAPLTKSGALIIKIFAFGAAGLVASTLLGIIIYLLFFKKGRLERKAAREEEEARNLENGILPKSKHFGIGKVPKKKHSPPPPPPQKRYSKAHAMSAANVENDTPSPGHNSRPSQHTGFPTRSSSSLSAKTTREFTRTPRVSWGSETTVDILPPPKAMTSEKIVS